MLLTQALFDSGKEIIGIEFNSGLLRIAYLKIKGKRKTIIDLSANDISNLKDNDIIGIIKSFLTNNKIKNPKVILTISANSVITKNIEVPSQDPKEIEDIVNLQAVRHTPYVRQEIIVDYSTVGVYKKGYTKIILVIVTKEIVRKQLELIEKAGIAVNRICLATEAVGEFFTKIFNFKNNDAPIALLYVDNVFSYFSVVLRGRTIFIRSIPLGSQHLSQESEQDRPKFTEEIKKSFEMYKNEDIDKMPQRLILLEEEPKLKNIILSLTENIGFPLDAYYFVTKIDALEPARRILQSKRSALAISVIAAGFESEGLKVELLPEEIKLRKSFESRSKDIIKSGILALTIFILIFIIFATKISFLSLYLNQLTTKAKIIEQDAAKLENKFNSIQAVKKYLTLKGYSLELLDKIYDNLPKNMRLAEIKVDREARSLSIKGTSESMALIFTFIDNLGQVEYFKEVKTKYTTKRKEDSKDVADFELAIILVDK